MFVYLEDAWHPIADDERTACGIVIPPLQSWVRDVPEGEPIHCGPTATVNDAPKKPKAKKKG